MDFFIPEPILLNCWKHHTGYIKHRIDSCTKKSLMKLITEIKSIGSSVMDLYFGDLDPNGISHEIIQYLAEEDKLNESVYRIWLENAGDFINVSLSDGSEWTLRAGNQKDRYVHIHPARYSTFTLRVRSVSLKTAIVINTWSKIYGVSNFDLDTINRVRKEFLNESPLEEIEPETGLGKLISLINIHSAASRQPNENG